jgi:hypothetical protein
MFPDVKWSFAGILSTSWRIHIKRISSPEDKECRSLKSSLEWGSRDRISGDQKSWSKLSLIRRSKLPFWKIYQEIEKGEWGSRNRISGDQNSRSKLSLIRRSKLLQNFRRSKLPFLQNLSGDQKGPRGP